MRRRIVSGLVTITALAVVAVAIAAPTSTTAPKLVGTVAFDQTVTCDPGTFSPAPAVVSFSWSAGGATVAGQTTNRFTIDKPYYMGGYPVSCTVTAMDAADATTAVSTPDVLPAPGRTTLKITSLKVFKRGAFVIKGQVGPKDLISGSVAPGRKYLTEAEVVLDRKLSGKTVDQLSPGPVAVDSHGRFTITGHDRAGKSKVLVRFFCGNGCTGIWAPAEVTRTVHVTKGFTGSPGTTVGIQ
jgi:hypothetical protein